MFYTNVALEGDNILFRGYKDGKKITQKFPYSPSLFIESATGDFRTLDGVPLVRNQFPTIRAMTDFIKEHRDIKNLNLYGMNRVQLQFINEFFDDMDEYDLSLISIKSIDIETKTEHGAIDTTNAPEEITLITLKDFHTKRITTFGCWDWEFDIDRITKILEKQNVNLDLSRLSNFEYVKCTNERDLLNKFIDFWSSDYPDIVTGYNIELFDITYLSSRIKKLLGTSSLKRCSPWNRYHEKEVPITPQRNELAIKWEGISILDFMQLYKKLSFKNLENYKLDTVAAEELKRTKLSYEFATFREFYEKDPYAFTLYNIIDTDLIDELEERMQLIQLVISVAYEAKINYNDTFSRLASWESIIYNFLMKHKIIPKLKDPNQSQHMNWNYGDNDVDDDDREGLVDIFGEKQAELSSGIVGAFVKDVKPGMYEWCVSFDATSLYPSIIMAWNMSPDTLVNESAAKYNPTPDDVLELVNRKRDLSHLKANDMTYAANGQEFSKKTKGWFPKIVEHFFEQRQIAKKEMLRLESSGDTSIETLKRIVSLDIKQMAFKILLNSLYGAMGNEHFTYYDTRIAEGITSTGQMIIRNCEININKYLSKILKEEKEYCFYCDTDSLHITLDKLVQKHYSSFDNRKISHILSDICKDVLSPEIDKYCNDLSDYVNLYTNKISFKREFIASRGIYTAKKRYCLSVYNSEGVEYDPPKDKIMGLEIVRSSTPTIVRKKLKEAVNIILNKDNDDLIEYVASFKEMWVKLPYNQIAFPRGINNLMKYYTGGAFAKKTPVHVKAALTYNYLLQKHNVDGYEPIKDGDKIKFLYLYEPNLANNNSIAFFDTIPKEFGIDKFIDYNTMLEKTFLAPLRKITGIIGWQAEVKASLEDLWA